MSQALILTAFVIVVLTTLSFIISRGMLEQSIRAQISSVAAIAENGLESTLQAHRERASLLTNNGDIRAVIAGKAGPQALARLLSTIQRDQPSLLAMEVYNGGGVLLSGAGDSIGLPEKARKLPLHQSVVDAHGWNFYDVYTPVWADGGERIGYLALRYRAQDVLSSLLTVAPTLGSSADVVLVRKENDDMQLIHPSLVANASFVMELGQLASDSLFEHTLEGKEGVTRTEDYRGRDALVAYRYLPALGWSLIIQVDRKEALAGVHDLAVAHASIGTLLLVLAAALAWLLAHQVTSPLRLLTERVRHLRPGAWNIRRSVHTSDEVEVLDRVVVDMAARLKDVYEKQEDILEERTVQLKKQYALDRAILESVEFGVITVDRKGVIIGANPAATALLGQSRDVLAGKAVASAIAICGHRGDAFKGEHPVMQCLRSRKPQRSPVNAHFNVRRTDDALLPVMYAVSPLISGGTLFGAIIVFQDITEERRLDYLKSEFISLASHQLRTPLSALRWYVELFGDSKKNLTTEQRGYLSEMETSISRMVALLTSLLHAARLEGENLAPEIQNVDMSQLLREMEQDCMSLVHEAGLSCKVSIPRGKVMLRTDPTLLRIVLQNLMSNAVKYTPKNSKLPIVIELTEKARAISVMVKDNGMGIPKAEQKRVFQKFFRAKNVRKRDTDGNGLGLYITRTIIERLGGIIAFRSAENKGTVFTVTMPKTPKK